MGKLQVQKKEAAPRAKRRSARKILKPVKARQVKERKPTARQIALREKKIAELILSHRENGRKLARSILRRWQVTMPGEEVDSLVDLTLCEAGRRYSEEKGASFITFLFYHLRGHLVRAVAAAANDTSIFYALAQSAGADTTDWASTPTGETLVLPELYNDSQKEADSPESLLASKERLVFCREAVAQLDLLEQQIIDRSYVQDEALVDIARALGYSRCHISRVKKRALERLRGFVSEATQEELPAVDDDELDSGAERVVRRHRRRRIVIHAEKLAQKAAA